MANHRALLLTLSLLVAAVAFSRADDMHGRGLADAAAVADPDCDEREKPEKPAKPRPSYTAESPNPATSYTAESPNPATESVDQELCSGCEEPKTPEPPCDTCYKEPKEKELTCSKVHAVQEGETCDSVGQCAGLGQDDFLRINPNLCCDKLFVGQWVCLDATCSD